MAARRTKAPTKVGVLSLWGDPEITVKVRRPRYAPRRPKREPSPASHLAALIVRTYARFRRRAGFSLGDENWRGELASTARRIAESERWPEDVMLEAAAEFAETQTHRRPAFFLEWIREAYWRLADREHAYWKQQERQPIAPEVEAVLARAIRHPRSPESTVRVSDVPLHKVRCAACREVIFVGDGATPHACNPVLLIS